MTDSESTYRGRYFLVLVAALLLGPVGTGIAQNGNQPFSTSSASVMADARVIHLNVNLVTMREVRFDKVQPSQGEIYVHPITNSNAGMMKAEGAPDADVQVSYQSQVQLIHETGAPTLTMNYEIAGHEQDNQTSAELITNASQNFRLNSEGEFYIWVGGRINITNAVSGNYEGEFTVEVEYI